MKLRSILSIGLVCLLTGLGAVRSTAAEDNSAALFAALPAFGDASLSETGKYLAFVTPIDGNYNVIISGVDTPGSLKRISFGSSAIIQLAWHNDTHLLVRLQTAIREPGGLTESVFLQTYIVPMAGSGTPIPINRNGHISPGGFSDAFVDLSPDATHIYMSALEPYDRTNYQYKLMRVDLEKGGTDIVREGKMGTAKWISDGQGHIKARIDVFGANHLDVMVPDRGDFRKVATLVTSEAASAIAGLTEDGRSLAIFRRDAAGKRGLYPLDLTSGEIGQPLFSDPAIDVGQVLVEGRTLRAIGVLQRAGDVRSVYLSPERQRLQSQIEAILPGRSAHLLSTSGDGKKVLVLTTSPRSAPALHFVNLLSSRIDNIAESYPQLRGMPLADVSIHPYRTRDGVDLAGILTLPPGKDPRNLPLIVLPSAGFVAESDFDWFAQFLAHRGYAVLQAGARSMKTLNDVLDMSDLTSWIKERQADLAGAMDDLVAQGVVARDRVCIAGGGYEGLIALSALFLESKRYACAFTFRTVADLGVLMKNAQYDYAGLALNEFGSPFISKHAEFRTPELDKISPVKQSDAMDGVVLLLDVDKLFWNTHSLNMMKALQQSNKPVEMVNIKAADGALTDLGSRVTLLNAIDKFLASHIGN